METPTKTLPPEGPGTFPPPLPELPDNRTLITHAVHLRLKGYGWEKVSRTLRKKYPSLTTLAAYAIKLRVREAERKVGIGRGGKTVRI